MYRKLIHSFIIYLFNFLVLDKWTYRYSHCVNRTHEKHNSVMEIAVQVKAFTVHDRGPQFNPWTHMKTWMKWWASVILELLYWDGRWKQESFVDACWSIILEYTAQWQSLTQIKAKEENWLPNVLYPPSAHNDTCKPGLTDITHVHKYTHNTCTRAQTHTHIHTLHLFSAPIIDSKR